MASRIQTLMLVLLLLIVGAIILIAGTIQREHDFEIQQRAIQLALANGVANEIAERIRRQRANLRLFADEYHASIVRLATHPDDNRVYEAIQQRLAQRFPKRLAFTLTTANGIPLVEDIDTLIGDVCQLDIAHFVQAAARSRSPQGNRVFIHPQPGNYHYDLMARWQSGGRIGVFFVSFRPDDLTRLLGNYQLPGHELMLVKASDPSLIELTAEGARDHLSREIRLNPAERRAALLGKSIAGSDWRVIDLPDERFAQRYERQLWREAGMIFALILIASLIMLAMIWRLSPIRR